MSYSSTFVSIRVYYRCVLLFLWYIYVFRPLNGPLFHLDLVLDETGSRFSTDLDAFKPTLVSIFDRGIQATHSVPQMERVSAIYIA